MGKLGYLLWGDVAGKRFRIGAILACIAGLVVGFQSASATVFYSADFDSTDPGRKELQGGQIEIVDNPLKDDINNSAKVGRCRVLEGGKRAEYSSPRLPTIDKRYVYRWMYYLPEDFITAELDWRVLSQWKTYPCEVCTNYADEICGGCGGIFDEMRVTSGNFDFRWRAEPDCREYQKPLITGRWISFIMEILWTNSSNGYAKLWMDGVLVADHKNIKTLFDRFPLDNSCNIYWGIGLYGPLHGKPYTDIFIDNISITDEIVTIPDTPTTQSARRLEYSQSQWSADVSTGSFLITSPFKGNFEITLYDTQGKSVSTVYSSFLSPGTRRYYCSRIPAGMYIFSVRQKGGKDVFKKSLVVLD